VVPRFHTAVSLGLPETSSKSDPLFSCSKRLAEDQLNAAERKDTHKKIAVVSSTKNGDDVDKCT